MTELAITMHLFKEGIIEVRVVLHTKFTNFLSTNPYREKMINLLS
jgi:hypothetical protein